MTKMELLELIANRENSGVEFKRDDVRPEQVAREIVAMANFRGGRLLLGVEDDGIISGLQRKDTERWVMDIVLGRKVHPMLLPFYEEIQVDSGRRVAVVTVAEGTAKPYVVRHNDREETYVRVGSISRRATREQQARLFALGGMLRAELLPVAGSSQRDLSRERLEDYLTAIMRDRVVPVSDQEWVERLCGLGFMVEREESAPVCSIAGLLLFGHRPRRQLRQAGVRWMAFRGSDKAYDALDDQVFDAPLVALWRESSGGVREVAENGLIEMVLTAVRPFVSDESASLVQDVRRERRWRYPPEAVREALVNAVAHRDWTRHEEVEIASYADRLEVTSPGGLPNTMTISKMMAGQRSPRNSLIVDVLRDYGYVEGRGMGVRHKIVPLLRQWNGVEPAFEETEDYLRLTMRRASELPARESSGG